MGMKTSTKVLWELIRNMSSNEKQFFKREAGEPNKGNPPLYIKLFDCLTRLKDYDEELVIKKLQFGIIIEIYWRKGRVQF